MRFAKCKTTVTDSLGYDYVVNFRGEFKEVCGDLELSIKSVYISTFSCLNADEEYKEPSEDFLINITNLYDLDWSLSN